MGSPKGVSAVKHIKINKKLMNIRTGKKNDIIIVKKGMNLRRVDTTVRVTEVDLICGRRVLVTRVNKTSLQIRFLEDTYRIPFKVNPDVEIVERQIKN